MGLLDRMRGSADVAATPNGDHPQEPEADADGSDPRAYELIASAIAGRPLHIVAGGSGPTYTNGETIFLAADAPVDAVLLHAALIAAGSLDTKVTGKLVGRPGSRARYLTLEAVRAVNQLRDIVPSGLFERVDALYDGGPTGSPAESFSRAQSPRIPSPPTWLGAIRPVTLLRADALPEVEASDSLIQKAAAASEAQTLDELDDEAADDADRSRIMDLLATPVSNPWAMKLAKMLGMGSAPGPGGEDTGGEELSISGDRSGRGTSAARRAEAPSWLRLQASGPQVVGRLYHEWSCHKNRYREDWCSVAEYAPFVRADAALPATPSDRPLRLQLARLGLADQVYRRRPDGDTLDVTALIDHVIDRATGHADDPRVYETRRRTAHDLGVLILLDATGSTGESTDGQQVFEGQRLLAARLTAALDELGDRVATYGFYSRGRHDVRYLRVKGFEQHYDQAARHRLASMQPNGFTRLGAAIRHGTHLLSTEAGATNLLLVVLGDGLPYDDGYEDRYAQEDTRRALSEAVALGVGCACVSTRSTVHGDTIERVWGHVAHRALADPDQLAQHVRPLFRAALREAAASRRPGHSERSA